MVLDVRRTGRTGYEISDELRRSYDVHAELPMQATIVFVVGLGESVAALRRLADRRAAIEGLIGVTAKPGSARVPGARSGAFCRGVDITLEFEPTVWQSAGLYLLAAVVDHW